MSQDEREDQAKQAGASIWETIKRTSGSAADAAQRALQIQRLNAQIRKLEAQQRKVVFSIGRKVYELHGIGKVRNKDVLDDCLTIDQLSEQAEAVKAQIEQIRAEAKERPADQLEDSSFLTEETEETEVPIETDTPAADDPAPEQPACCGADDAADADAAPEPEAESANAGEDIDIELGPKAESEGDD